MIIFLHFKCKGIHIGNFLVLYIASMKYYDRKLFSLTINLFNYIMEEFLCKIFEKKYCYYLSLSVKKCFSLLKVRLDLNMNDVVDNIKCQSTFRQYLKDFLTTWKIRGHDSRVNDT